MKFNRLQILGTASLRVLRLAIDLLLPDLAGPGLSLFPRATIPGNGRPDPGRLGILCQSASHNRIQAGTLLPVLQTIQDLHGSL